MKARTKLEQQIERLSKNLQPIGSRHIMQAKDKCFAHEAWQAGRDFGCFCTDCGHEFYNEAREGKTVCPKCGHRLTVRRTRRENLHEKKMFAIVTTCGSFQVVRYVEIQKHIHRLLARDGQIGYEYCEVARGWIDEEGKERFQAVSLAYNFHASTFRYSTPLTLRPEHKTYDMITDGIYSPQRVLPVIRRNGYNGVIGKDSPSFVMRLLLSNTYYETLWKAGYRDFLNRTDEINALQLNWPSLRICIRQHYKPSDAGLWYDMMRNVRLLGLDERNPHFVCPADLKAAHDEMTRRVEVMRAKEREEERKAQLRKDRKLLEKKRGYFGICFGTSSVKVTVLSSIEEYEAEGKAMHHCVFTNRYFDKKNSLILSAKDAAGTRLATVELSLNSYKVLQCRAACNAKPERYDEIVKLVESHANDFRKAKKHLQTS